MSRLRTVWITKYALSQGLYKVKAEIVDGKYASTESKGFSLGLFTRDWKPSREEAVAEAERMRAMKIASLKKQIAKLEAMTFKETGNG
ncbi:MAG: hypothetical protein ACTHU0_22145 [Kofleriaceae bacterium]